MVLDIDKVELLAAGKCWTLPDVTKQAGLANQTLYKVKRGETKATARTIGKVARALGCTPADIIRWE